MASVGPAPPLSPPALRTVAATTHLTPPSPLQLPSSYRTPSPIQIELELVNEVRMTAPAGFESRPLAAARVDIGGMFDLAQRIELTGVIDMPIEKASGVVAEGGAGSPHKEKKACTGVSLERALISRRTFKLSLFIIVHTTGVCELQKGGASRGRA